MVQLHLEFRRPMQRSRAYQTGKVSPGNYSVDVRLSSVGGQGETQKSAIPTLKEVPVK